MELLYIEVPPNIFVIPSMGAPGWSSAALRAGHASIWKVAALPMGAGELRSASLLTDPALMQAIREQFREKYGPMLWNRHFALHSKILILAPSGHSVPPSPRELVCQEFDAVAATYTASIDDNPFERYLKQVATAGLREIFRDRDPLLEIGAGTGIETIPMLQDGHRVTSVDISPAMRDELKRRISMAGLGDRASVLAGGLASLVEDLPFLPAGSFDGAWSTFGAPNLEPNVEATAYGLARLLRPGAPLALGMLSRWAISPLLYEMALGHWNAVRARHRQPIPAEGIRYPLDVYAWTPLQYARFYHPFFTLAEIRPLSALCPPYSSPRLLRSLGPEAWAIARRLDRWLTPRMPALSEWVLIVLHRTWVPATEKVRRPEVERSSGGA
ncbi:MAG: class I SAM-dependent methyltransferase [Thermoplasmata archaeon]